MISLKERRQNKRVRTVFPVYCKLKTEKGFFAVSKDLSEAGLKLISSHALPLNRYFSLEINMIDFSLRLKAKTVWKMAVDKEKNSFGIKFYPPQEQKQAIAGFISSLDN